MDINKLKLLPLAVKVLGEDLKFDLRLNAINDDYNDWIFFRGDYANDEAVVEIGSQDLSEDPAAATEGAVEAKPRAERARTSTEIILRLVDSWSLTDNGKEVEVTPAVVADLNLGVKNIICAKIFETLDSKKLSATPSHWLAGLGRRGK